VFGTFARMHPLLEPLSFPPLFFCAMIVTMISIHNIMFSLYHGWWIKQ